MILRSVGQSMEPWCRWFQSHLSFDLARLLWTWRWRCLLTGSRVFGRSNWVDLAEMKMMRMTKKSPLEEEEVEMESIWLTQKLNMW